MNKCEKISILIASLILLSCVSLYVHTINKTPIFKPRYPVLQDIAILQKVRDNTLDQIDIKETQRLYNINLESFWSYNTHPDWVPLEPKVLPFLAWSHSDKSNIFEIGSKSSIGFESFIETGKTKLLVSELLNEKKENNIRSYTKGNTINSPGFSENVLKVSIENPYITLVAPIHPSPDWFISTINIKLYSPESGWVDKIELPVLLLDSGTDDGIDFTSNNADTKSALGVHYLTVPNSQPIAKITISNAT